MSSSASTVGRPRAVADFYSVLGILRTASTEEVRAAFLVAARASHPDKQRRLDSGSPSDGGSAALNFVAVRNAWDVLGDPTQRAAYDDFLDRNAAEGTSFAEYTSSAGSTAGSTGPSASKRWPLIPVSDEVNEEDTGVADDHTHDGDGDGGEGGGGDYWLTYPCRCGSGYKVSASKLHQVPKEAGLIRQCEGCSLYIRFFPMDLGDEDIATAAEA